MCETKVCKKCGTEKGVGEFGPFKRAADGKDYYCRTCRNKSSNERYHRNRQEEIVKRKHRRAENAESSRNKRREHYARNREVLRAQAADWRNRNSEKVKMQRRKSYAKNAARINAKRREKWSSNGLLVRDAHLKRRYKISLVQFNEMLVQQGNKCLICKVTLRTQGKRDKTSAVVDHCHKSASRPVRGILCNRCNGMLGMANDDPTVLEAGAAYLHAFQAKMLDVVL
jgi:hypothetical protein